MERESTLAREATGTDRETAAARNNVIIEAALSRARRASENANRALLPRIEPASSPVTKESAATARALDPGAKVSPAPAGREQRAVPAKPRREPPAPARASDPASAIGLTDPPAPVALAQDEIEPRDYLAAEIKKIDKALTGEFNHSESASIPTQLVTGVVDLLAIALSSTPFAAIAEILSGNLAAERTRVAIGLMAGMLAVFYFGLTQGLVGKTFGMMLTNTRVVDVRTFEQPSPVKVLVRTLGYFVALGSLGIGMAWALFDSKRRAWHDLLSGTVVVRDF